MLKIAFADMARIDITSNMPDFQTVESTEIHPGYLEATPHLDLIWLIVRLILGLILSKLRMNNLMICIHELDHKSSTVSVLSGC